MDIGYCEVPVREFDWADGSNEDYANHLAGKLKLFGLVYFKWRFYTLRINITFSYQARHLNLPTQFMHRAFETCERGKVEGEAVLT